MKTIIGISTRSEDRTYELDTKILLNILKEAEGKVYRSFGSGYFLEEQYTESSYKSNWFSGYLFSLHGVNERTIDVIKDMTSYDIVIEIDSIRIRPKWKRVR